MGASQYVLQKKNINRLKNALCGCLINRRDNKSYSERFFSMSRKDLVDNYRIKLKKKVYKIKKQDLVDKAMR